MKNGKRVLIVDDEPDVLETLEDLLPMCLFTKALTFEKARDYLQTDSFDIAIPDIMGVNGYELLALARQHQVISVMLTARVLSPEDVKKSYIKGASFYIPKEEMLNIDSFLEDVLEALGNGTREGLFDKQSIGPTMKSVLKKSKIPVIVVPFVEGEEPSLPITPGWRKQ